MSIDSDLFAWFKGMESNEQLTKFSQAGGLAFPETVAFLNID